MGIMFVRSVSAMLRMSMVGQEMEGTFDVSRVRTRHALYLVEYKEEMWKFLLVHFVRGKEIAVER